MESLRNYAKAFRILSVIEAVLALIGGMILSKLLLAAICCAAIVLLMSFSFAALMEAVAANNELLVKTEIYLIAIKQSLEAPVIKKKDPAMPPVPRRPVPRRDDLIVCPMCGQRQRANRTICLNCGSSLEKTSDNTASLGE